MVETAESPKTPSPGRVGHYLLLLWRVGLCLLPFQELLENQGSEPVFIKQFLSHGLNLGGGNLIHLLVEAVNVLLPAIVQEALAEVEGEVLAVVASHAYLTLNLFLGSL